MGQVDGHIRSEALQGCFGDRDSCITFQYLCVPSLVSPMILASGWNRSSFNKSFANPAYWCPWPGWYPACPGGKLLQWPQIPPGYGVHQ